MAAFLVAAAQACSQRQGRVSLRAAPGAQSPHLIMLPVSVSFPRPSCLGLELGHELLATWWLCCGAWLSGGHRGPGNLFAAGFQPAPVPGSLHVPLVASTSQCFFCRLRKTYLLQALAPTPQLKGQITDTQHPSARRGGQADSGQVDACTLTGSSSFPLHITTTICYVLQMHSGSSTG